VLFAGKLSKDIRSNVVEPLSLIKSIIKPLAEGVWFSKAIGDYSHAGGNASTASGNTSFVFGTNSVAYGSNTIVLGSYLTGTTVTNTTYVETLALNTVRNYVDDAAADADATLAAGGLYTTGGTRTVYRKP